MKTHSNQPGAFHSSRPLARTWRCSHCAAKLGTWIGRTLIIKQHEAVYRFREPGAEVEAICRTCGLMNKGISPS